MRKLLAALLLVLAVAGPVVSATISGGGGGGTTLNGLTSDATGLYPTTTDTRSLGTTTKMWSDLFLASGAVINFDNGDVTWTHAANLITQAGGDFALAAGLQYLISTDTGIRRDAAGSLSFTNGSTGHATGLSLGTPTPKTILGAARTNDSVLHVLDADFFGFLVAGGPSGALTVVYDSDGTVDKRIGALALNGGVLTISRWTDGFGAEIQYLKGDLATDVVTLGSASVAGLTASWGSGGGIAMTDSANGKAVNVKQITELHTLAAAGTSDTTIQFPANALILGVAVRVTTGITGCATFQVGDSGSATRYGTGLALTAGTTNQSGGTTNPTIPSAAQAIRFTCVGGGASFTAGVVRVVGYYIDMTAPTSMLPALDMMRQIAAADPQLRRAA